MKFICPFLFILAGIFFYFSTTVSISTDSSYNKIDNGSFTEIKTIDTGYLFVDIFVNNLIIGFMLSILGFISGGLVTTVILFWNGYLISIIYDIAFSILTIEDILYFSKHVPIEIFALILFAKIGIEGFFFYRRIICNNKIEFKKMPKFNEFILPIILLFTASIIEVI